MRTIRTIIVLLVLPSITYCQSGLPRDEHDRVVFTEVVKVELLSKNEIYKKAKLWIVSTLKSGDNMVELDGTSSDQIIGTGNLLLDKFSMLYPNRE
ncbi:MAG: DUF4468 domain-containing protein, partial [Bacteroidota bacterium]